MKGIAKVAKLDASIHRKFDSVYGLKGYPQVVLIPAGTDCLIKDPKTNQFTMFTKAQELLTAFKNGLNKKLEQIRDFWSKD